MRPRNWALTTFEFMTPLKMDPRKIITSQSRYTDIKYRTHCSELRDIKQMLLSGNKDEITIAVGRVLSQINDSGCVVEMITSDISEFLCDAILPFDPYVSGTVYTCLGAMARYKSFFAHNHSSFALETVVRALHFIIKGAVDEPSVGQPLNVILIIVQGYANFEVMPEKRPFENLVNLLLCLLKMKPVSEDVKYHGGLIINSLFDVKLWRSVCSHSLIEICEKWFELIYPSGETLHSLTEKFTSLSCSVSEKTLRFLVKGDSNSNQLLINNDLDDDSEAQLGITKKIITFLMEKIAPEIRNILPSDQNEEIEILTNFFTCLIHIFDEFYPQGNKIAQKLSEMGFIQLIKNLLSHDHLRRYEKIAKLCLTVLKEILLSLSDDLFTFPDMWPSGRDHFRKELSAGMTLLPMDSSAWFHKLSDIEVNRSSRLALIVYFYVYSLTAIGSSFTELDYPSAVKLLDSSAGMNSAPLLIKAVWFIFVMSQISKKHTSLGSNSWATKRMSEILENQKEFSLIYTHHPALLYWTFSSSKMSCRIQCQMVKLWLENRSPDCTILDDLMKNSADVRLAIFQLLQDGHHDRVAHLAFSSLKSYMLHSSDDVLSSNVWLLLPQILAKYTTDSSAAVKVDYIVELATLKVPERPDINRIARIASLLPEAVHKSDLISLSSALELSLQLLEISLKEEDNRVLFAYLGCDHFIRRIVNGMTTEFAEVALISLKTVIILWNVKLQRDHLPRHYRMITLNPHDLLKILDGNNVELIKMGLLLIERMFISQFKSALLIVPGISTEFRSMLLFSLENVLFKFLPTISVPAWKCVQYSLIQEKSLIGDCFLNELIKYGVGYLKETPEMVDFLITWMECKLNAEPFYDGSRTIKPNYFLEAIEEVAFFLAENFIEEWDRLRRTVLKLCKHFSIDTSREPYKKIADVTVLPH